MATQIQQKTFKENYFEFTVLWSVGTTSAGVTVLTSTGPQVVCSSLLIGTDEFRRGPSKEALADLEVMIITLAQYPGNVALVQSIGYASYGRVQPGQSPDPSKAILNVVEDSEEFHDSSLVSHMREIIISYYKLDPDKYRCLLNKFYVIDRNHRLEHCKIGGQWTQQACEIMQKLNITGKSKITTVVDLGGGSGTIYERELPIEDWQVETDGIMSQLYALAKIIRDRCQDFFDIIPPGTIFVDTETKIMSKKEGISPNQLFKEDPSGELFVKTLHSELTRTGCNPKTTLILQTGKMREYGIPLSTLNWDHVYLPQELEVEGEAKDLCRTMFGGANPTKFTLTVNPENKGILDLEY